MGLKYEIGMNILVKIVSIFIILSVLSMSFGTNITVKDIYVSGASYSQNQVLDKVGVVVLNNGKFENQDVLQIDYKFNDKILANKCQHTLIFSDNSSFQKKIYCPIPTQFENGLYSIEVSVLRDENELIKLESIEFFYDSTQSFATTRFTQTPEGTKVKIYLPDNLSDGDIIQHEIPKEVLERVTLLNKDQVIQSQKEFIIIQEDPIIAWEVSSKEESIEYTIVNKTVSEEEKLGFETSKQEENSITIIAIFIIIVLLIIIFVPFFFKK